MKKRGIVLAEFGNREVQVIDICKHLRKLTLLPIVIFTDMKYDLSQIGGDTSQCFLNENEVLWKNHRRYHNRNNDYWKIKGALSCFEQALILDDDMRIVNEQFTQGFDFAAKYGLCLPINPRTYFGIDREIGDDVSISALKQTIDIPYYLPANNMGTIFFDTRLPLTRMVLDYYLRFMEGFPCRGPVAMAAACYRTETAPLLLTEEWCVCGGYTNYKSRSNKRIDPIFLHIGHEDVKKWYENNQEFERFRI